MLTISKLYILRVYHRHLRLLEVDTCNSHVKRWKH